MEAKIHVCPSGCKVQNKQTQTREIHTQAGGGLFCGTNCPFPLACNYLFFVLLQRRSCLPCLFFFLFFFFTSCTMPLVLLFNFVVHTNQIKSSLSQQSCSDFFTFLNQAVSSVSTSLYCSPQWQLRWRVASVKLTQQTEDDRRRNQHTHLLSRPSKRLITETWNLLSFS